MDGATLFPLFDGLRLDVPDPQGGAGTQAIDLETYATATEQYRSTVAGVLRQVAAKVGKASARPALLAQDDAGAESMAAFIFVDVFSLIGRALLQSAIDAFDNYSYALQPGDSIASIVAAFNLAGNAIDADDGIGFQPSKRAGNMSSALRNANSAENVMPSRRNGSDNSHAIGHNTSASNASGQHSTSSRHQADRAIRVFMASGLANGNGKWGAEGKWGQSEVSQQRFMTNQAGRRETSL